MHLKKGIFILCLLMVVSMVFTCQKQQPVAPESATDNISLFKAAGESSASPQFNPPTPCNQGFDVLPGNNISFSVNASDPDPGDIVTLRAAHIMGMEPVFSLGLPAGATMTPPLPITGNPVQGTFSWTPNLNQQGWWGIKFRAEDQNGNRTICTVGIDVGPVPPPPPPGGEGCTPGAWKNHLLNIGEWGPTGYSPSQTVGSVFSGASAFPSLASSTLLQALSLPGGPTVLGMAQNLMRAGVAGLLNAAHPNINYAVTENQVINAVNAALASGNRQTMENLKDKLDIANNAGCPI